MTHRIETDARENFVINRKLIESHPETVVLELAFSDETLNAIVNACRKY